MRLHFQQHPLLCSSNIFDALSMCVRSFVFGALATFKRKMRQTFFTAYSLGTACGNTLVHLEESRINNLFLRISKCEQIALCLVLLNHVTSINFHDLTKTECV